MTVVFTNSGEIDAAVGLAQKWTASGTWIALIQQSGIAGSPIHGATTYANLNSIEANYAGYCEQQVSFGGVALDSNSEAIMTMGQYTSYSTPLSFAYNAASGSQQNSIWGWYIYESGIGTNTLLAGELWSSGAPYPIAMNGAGASFNLNPVLKVYDAGRPGNA